MCRVNERVWKGETDGVNGCCYARFITMKEEREAQTVGVILSVGDTDGTAQMWIDIMGLSYVRRGSLNK